MNAGRPGLGRPTAEVRDSYLAGERAVWAEEGRSPDWLADAEADFASFVAEHRRTQEMWGVPTTELWFTRGAEYFGKVMIRHELTPQLRREGGHIGYHVVPACRRRGYATAMLAGACAYCREIGMTPLLLTCTEDNVGSRRVIEANGGSLAGVADGICHYWITL